VQSAFCIAKQHLVATVPIDVLVNRQINFQNKVLWLGGRISNTTPA